MFIQKPANAASAVAGATMLKESADTPAPELPPKETAALNVIVGILEPAVKFTVPMLLPFLPAGQDRLRTCDFSGRT